MRWFMNLKWWQRVGVIAAPIVALLIVIPIATYLYFYNDIANQDRLMNRANTGIVLLDKDGKEFFSIGQAEHNDVIPLSKISDRAEQALIASEDKDFYDHGGFSFLSIVRSAYLNIFASDSTLYGGSTLTQQLAKNTLLSHDRTYLRKYQELTISLAIEQRYEKDEILAMYLNSVYFGNNSFGIEEAARSYFGKSASKLNLAEASMLIGVLPAPSAYSPIEGDRKLAKERQAVVLERMVKNGMVTQEEADAAQSQKLQYLPQKTATKNIAPHFTEMVLQELYAEHGEERVKRSGYQVYTTLDRSLQSAANSAISNNLSTVEAYGGSNASLVAIDPRTGAIRALVGSADYNNKEFGMVNMATAPRQPGSTMKPIYYTAALADGVITPQTVFRDEPTSFNGYKPLNATRQFYGDVSVRRALSWSLNIPSVKVMQRYGISDTIEAAEKVGITTLGDASSHGLSLAIGSAEVPLLEMTNAYSTYANAGNYQKTSMVADIEDKFGKDITPKRTLPKPAVSEQGAYLISDILSDAEARSGLFGSSLNVVGTDFRTKNVAVKTGTTDDNRDAWTIGYTPDITIGVWTGNNDNTVMQGGGGTVAGPIWRAVMSSAVGAGNPEFARPGGIVERTVCTATGRHTDVFLATAVEPSTCSTSPIEEEDQPKKQPEEDDQPDEDTEEEPTNGPDEGDEDEVDDEEPSEDEDTPPDPDDGSPGSGGIPPVTP